MQPRVPSLHRGERARQGVQGRARRGADFRHPRAVHGSSRFPYLSFSGGEPMVHPLFFKMVEFVCSRGGQLKIETNGHFLTPENCARLKSLGVKAVQVSLDGATRLDVQPDAHPRRIQHGDRRRAQSACRGRADRNQLLADLVQRPRDRHGHRPRLRARRLQLLHRPHDVYRQRGEGVAQARADRGAVRSNSSRRCTGRPRNTAAACGSISTRWGCSRNCATGCTIRPRC